MSEHLNVGDVTGPRWAGGTRNPGNDDAVRAWDEHVAEMRRAHPWIKPSIPIAGRGDFIVGYRARDAEVDVLREQLAAAEAAKADAWDEGAAANWDGQDLRHPNPYRTGDANA